MIRTTTRSRVAAEAIRDRVDFRTSSPNFRGETRDGTHYVFAGHLSGADAEALRHDSMATDYRIDYVVWSYSTPIAWHLTSGRWYIVNQSFSVTTSKHQGNLYLIPRAEHEAFLTPITRLKGETVTHRWRVECDTCGTVVSLHAYKSEAHTALHGHRMNGIHPDGVRR